MQGMSIATLPLIAICSGAALWQLVRRSPRASSPAI